MMRRVVMSIVSLLPEICSGYVWTIVPPDDYNGDVLTVRVNGCQRRGQRGRLCCQTLLDSLAIANSFQPIIGSLPSFHAPNDQAILSLDSRFSLT